jgi:O-antigen chain-terminating methyltransferase
VRAVAAAHDEKLLLLERRLDQHELAIGLIHQELAARDARFAGHEEKFESVDRAFVEADHRLGHLEKVEGEGIRDLMRHDDALFALLDQKVDRYRREAAELTALLGAALAARPRGGEPAAAPMAAPVASALDEWRYLLFEGRFRGTEEEIRERAALYLPLLADGARRGAVLDLGCGRGELLRLLGEHGISARGVDASGEMVRRCRDAGLAVEQAEVAAALAAAAPGSLGGVVAAHLVEHLPPEEVDRLVRLAWAALAPGGALLLETPNPTSLVVAARNFWVDPTHRRPVHPAALQRLAELAGFDPVEVRFLRPFAAAQRLPEIDLASLPGEQAELADQVNRLRDQLDDLLFGYQDYLLVAVRPP